MNAVAPQPLTWTRSRWAVLLALIFLSQLLLIYFLSARGISPVAATPQKTSIELFTRPASETHFFETFLASDPTLFAAANPHGFSGDAWMKVPERNYDVSERVESPFWLPLKPERLGSSVVQFVRTNALAPVAIVENIAPKMFTSPILDLRSPAKTNSLLRVEGDLASREMIEIPKLQSWPANEILSNTVTQVTVDRRGAVLSVRLLARSGSENADRVALGVSRNLQFVPGGRDAITDGKLIFDWQMVPVAATNSTGEIPASQ